MAEILTLAEFLARETTPKVWPYARVRHFDSAHFAEIRQSLPQAKCARGSVHGRLRGEQILKHLLPKAPASLRWPSSEEEEGAEARFSRIATSAP